MPKRKRAVQPRKKAQGEPKSKGKAPAVKRLKLSPLSFVETEVDPVIEHLRESSQSGAKPINIFDEIKDQIALEGLTGIKIGRLFHILEAKSPQLGCLRDERCQRYIWSTIVLQLLPLPTDNGVNIFYSPPQANHQNSDDQTEKPNLNELTNKGVFFDKQIRLPNQTVKRFAKADSWLYPVQDGHTMGSCCNYLSRINITKEAIEYSLKEDTMPSLHALNQKYNLDNIFLVAGQKLRNMALFPNWADPNVDIKLREYCTLEHIGKSRTLGTIFPKDKTLGRYRIMLVAKGFITQTQETFSSPVLHHLKRFSTTKVVQSKELAQKLRKLIKRGVDDDDDEDDEDEYDDDEDAFDDNSQYDRPNKNFCCDPSRVSVDRSILNSVYDTIASSNGLTKLDIRQRLRLPKFHLRNHLKNLLSLKMIYTLPPANSESSYKIFKTVHKSNKLRDKIKQNKANAIVRPSTGIMSTWDDIDLRAKKMIGHKRSNFSQAEDSLLILCRITSLLIDPTKNLCWCVNKRIVRDLLHSELVESHDKTSDACLRRIKYLRKLPNNIMSINELTAELRDDTEITKLIDKRSKSITSDTNMNRLFRRVLRRVRDKIPNLLGISLPEVATGAVVGETTPSENRKKGLVKVRKKASLSCSVPAGNSPTSKRDKNSSRSSASYEIRDHNELKEKYKLVDCQSVASISLAPTYEVPKNAVDIRYNNVCLVTMAFMMCSSFTSHSELGHEIENNDVTSQPPQKDVKRENDAKHQKQIAGESEPEAEALEPQAETGPPDMSPDRVSSIANSDGALQSPRAQSKRAYQLLLEKFYALYPDKLISSALSKLAKRSLLTRKCPPGQAGLFRPRTKMSLKLNQSVLFLLNRYQSSSLIQLARPISSKFVVDLEESNEMSSIALLTSLCSLSGFGLELKLRVPENVFVSEQDNENFACKPCNVRFSSPSDREDIERGACDGLDFADRALKWNRFLDATKPSTISNSESGSGTTEQQKPWLVKSFSSGRDKVEYSARLWKRIDGSAHPRTLFKLVESLLSWIIAMPGIEDEHLEREFSHLMPNEHLRELIELMRALELIQVRQIEPAQLRPRLFGHTLNTTSARTESEMRTSLIDTKSNSPRRDNNSDPSTVSVTSSAFDAAITSVYEPTQNAYFRFCQLLGHYCH